MPVKGVMATLLEERNQVDLAVSDATYNATTGLLSWFPYAHVELQALGRVQFPPGDRPPRPSSFNCTISCDETPLSLASLDVRKLARGRGVLGPTHDPGAPDWADVSPLLRGECTGCHGSTANDTGGGYRLDFYDMTPAVCGEAAQALGSATILAGGAAPLIKADVSLP